MGGMFRSAAATCMCLYVVAIKRAPCKRVRETWDFAQTQRYDLSDASTIVLIPPVLVEIVSLLSFFRSPDVCWRWIAVVVLHQQKNGSRRLFSQTGRRVTMLLSGDPCIEWTVGWEWF